MDYAWVSMDIYGLSMGRREEKHGLSMGVQDAQWISIGNAWISMGMRGGSAEETNVAFEFGVNFQGNSRELKGHSKIILSRIFDDLFDTVCNCVIDPKSIWWHFGRILDSFRRISRVGTPPTK